MSRQGDTSCRPSFPPHISITKKPPSAFVEVWLWPNGRVCPHCGVIDASGPLKGKSTRIGVDKCYACRKPFTVEGGTIFELTHMQAADMASGYAPDGSSKKGFSTNQFARILGVDYSEPGWFLYGIGSAKQDRCIASARASLWRRQVRRSGRNLYRRSAPAIAPTGNLHLRRRLSLSSKGAFACARAFWRSGEGSSTGARCLKPSSTRLRSCAPTRVALIGRVARAFASHQTVVHSADEYVRGDDSH